MRRAASYKPAHDIAQSAIAKAEGDRRTRLVEPTG
jgi:hypothetical protein